jgi:ATP-dependent RNA helicase DDX46/PRP5
MNTESASESNNQQPHVNNGDTSQPTTSQAQDGTNSEEEVVHETTVEELKAETKRIEEEMNKRRERLAAWRAARQKEEEEAQAKMEEEKKTRKEWSLENDDDDDEDDEANKMEEMTDAMDSSQDVDPLDAFMTEVKQEVIKVNETFKKKYTAAATGSSKKSQNMVDDEMIQELKAVPPNDNKEEVLQNDQDALEYSDEEENPDAELASALSTIFKKTKKKDLPKVDHKKINYEPFRKDFYVEVPDLARLTPEEVSAYRIELESIKIKGKDCPKPVKTWAQCGLHSRVLEVLKKNSYVKPTPIQAQAIPAIMSGRDLIGIAKTGSGKTLAFLLPLFRHVMDQNPLGPEDGPIALIFTPTRELAIQIYNETKKFCKVLKLKPVCVYGGTGVSEQIADLKRGAEIVICTPGRMIDVLAANSGRVTNLRRLTYLVLDEADRMFDMGFEPQVMRIISNSRPDRQTVMFSATFPRQMEALARKILTLPVEVQVGGRSVVCKDVEQTVVVLEENQKFFKLLELLGIYQEEGSVLVFVERQEIADGLIKDLMKASYPCLALHGGMDQSDRDSVISDFKNNSISLLVATSVAARGLDVRHLILVVNYDCPNHYEDYVHRCGRTGRAGRKGYACTLVTVNQGKYSGEIIKALELSGANVPEELSELWKNYTEQTKADGTAKVKKRASGFKGKGFKFNEEENAKSLEKKLKQKSSLNLNDSDDEDEYAILTMEKKLEEVFSGKPRKIDPAAPQINIIKNTQVHLNATASKNLAKAAAIADKIAASKNLGMNNSSISATQEAASNVLKGEEVNMSGAVLASQIAASINAKVGASRAKASKAYLPVGTVLPAKPTQDNNDDSDEDDLVPKRDMSQLIHFEDDIDINDFPQSIRFRITTRDVLDDIGDLADAYISVRGIYIPPGKQLKANEVRLHLLIEAKTERSVTLAKQEIKHVVKEEAQKLAARVNPYQVSGRYSVL